MTEILSYESAERAIKRMAHEILEKNLGCDNLALVGILDGGRQLALMLAKAIEQIEGVDVPVGFVDVREKRDDLSFEEKASVAERSRSQIPFDIQKKSLVLVDDVLFTGRTVRAAMDVLLEMGRPERIQLATLVDRGHRELPIRPDFVGKNIPTSRREKVIVNSLDSRINVILEK